MNKFRFKIAPLPPHFRGNWQAFLDAIVDRMEVFSDATGFTISDDAPEGNRGPWFKEGTQLFVWNEETSAYEGVDLSASFTAQVWIGEEAPDPEVYDAWLQLDGSEVVGLFAYLDPPGAWVAKDLTIYPGTITTAKLADGAVTPIKIRALAVHEEFIASVIPLDKWEKGHPGEFIRMSPDGEFSDWSTAFVQSPEITVGGESIIQWEHLLELPPHICRAVLVCKADDAGWVAGAQLDISSFWSFYGAGLPVPMFKTATTVGVQFGLGISVIHPGDLIARSITPSRWKLKFYLVSQ